MPILGLDIGGANLKAATLLGQAEVIPFALWKYPERLTDELLKLINRYPDHNTLAITMTGELCDCFETKRIGVTHILQATLTAAGTRMVQVWGTDGKFHTIEDALTIPQTIAAANWHGLATFAGRFAPEGNALLVDIGSTTTDIIPLQHGKPYASGLTDDARLRTGELVYTGVKRTPICAIGAPRMCAEFFAEMRDVYAILGKLPESTDTDTADGRPVTLANCRARLTRMYGADSETMSVEALQNAAVHLAELQESLIVRAIQHVTEAFPVDKVIISGSGEFLARSAALRCLKPSIMISLTDILGEATSTCAPAFAVATLAQERLS